MSDTDERLGALPHAVNKRLELLGRQFAQAYRDLENRPGVLRRMYESGLLKLDGEQNEKTNEDGAR